MVTSINVILSPDQWPSVLFKKSEDNYFFMSEAFFFYYSILDDCRSYSIHPAQCYIDSFRLLHDTLNELAIDFF